MTDPITPEKLRELAKVLERAIEDEDAGYCYASHGADVCVRDDGMALAKLVVATLFPVNPAKEG
jgi:hypothetical protein